jgi:glycine betaine catabolism B
MVTTLRVRNVVRATPRTRLLRLDLGLQGFAFRAGQAVMAGLHGSPLRKPYSIASAPGEAIRNGCIDLLVQVDDAGGPDPHLELAAPGVGVDIEGPFGRFALPPIRRGSSLLMVAGGTGIAPLRSMLIDALDHPTPPRIGVVYSARSVDELAYRDELDDLAAGGRITLRLTVTREENAAWPGRRGRIDQHLLAEALPSRHAACLVCGPPALVSDIRACLGSLGVPESAIVVERYDA